MQSKKCSLQNVLVFITASGLAEGPSADFSSFMWWQAALTLHREKSGSSYPDQWRGELAALQEVTLFTLKSRSWNV